MTAKLGSADELGWVQSGTVVSVNVLYVESYRRLVLIHATPALSQKEPVKLRYQILYSIKGHMVNKSWGASSCSCSCSLVPARVFVELNFMHYLQWNQQNLLVQRTVALDLHENTNQNQNKL